VKSIDFLPDIYRQRETLRRARLWWGIVVLVFSSALGASTIAQALLRHSTQQQLDSLAAEYAAAQTQVQELSTLQAQIVRAGHEANLYTYLENPWPRTQLLAQVVRPLPDCIRLSQIHIAEQESAKTAVQVGPRSTKAEEEAATKATGPEKDLARLQDEYDRRQTTIELDGHSTDVPRLHEYVSAISRSPLVAGATIKSLEAAANQAGKTRFTLRLVIRPGYCQQPNETPVITPVSLPSAGPRLPGGGA
jgi:Tfp pilus assembly protein PilN